MKGFGLILLYYFTWRSVITGSVLVGALLLVAALNMLLLAPYSAFPVLLLAYLGLLVVPYLSAAPALRYLIGSRSLTIIPRFALKAGLALLLLTVLLATFLPLVSWTLDRPAASVWFGLIIFVIASLYMLSTQLILPSRHAVGIFSMLPIVVVVLLNVMGETLISLAQNADFILGAALVTLAGWGVVLWVLAKRQTFAPASKPGDTAFTQQHTLKGIGKFAGLNLEGKLSAAGSLLFAYPASLPIRLINIGSYVVFYPVMSAALMYLMEPATAQQPRVTTLQAFLLISLFSGSISCWAQGEIGARARLLWLRLPGQRRDIWRRLESELWTNLSVLAGLAVSVAIGTLLINPAQSSLQHYVLIMVIVASYDSYVNLCARLYQWPSLIQALVMVLSLSATVAAIVFGFRQPELSSMGILEVVMLSLTVFLRMAAKSRFSSVDWLVVKHAVSKRVAQA